MALAAVHAQQPLPAAGGAAPPVALRDVEFVAHKVLSLDVLLAEVRPSRERSQSSCEVVYYTFCSVLFCSVLFCSASLFCYVLVRCSVIFCCSVMLCSALF